MQIEDTEVKIALTVREVQSLATLLAKVNSSLLCRERIDWTDIAGGMFDDWVSLEKELRNLVDFNPGRGRR